MSEFDTHDPHDLEPPGAPVDDDRPWDPDDDQVATAVHPAGSAPTLPLEATDADALDQHLEVPPDEEGVP